MNNRLVMLIDDNQTDNFITRTIIEANLFSSNVIIFTSALNAMNYLKDNERNFNMIPDYIFLDLNLPVYDGTNFLYEYQSLSKMVQKKSRVNILSSVDSVQVINNLIANEHVQCFIPKPIKKENLQKLLIEESSTMDVFKEQYIGQSIAQIK